jgi:pimeloyl-ACP methyl ester carboxylesterase
VHSPSPQLAYTWVPGREPVLVFVHGLGADGRCFRGALDTPRLQGRALLIPDLAGFGNSPYADGFSCTMEAQADLLSDLCQSLQIRQIAIVAHSMGGAVGIILAEKWPDTVTHFINAVGNLIPEDCFCSRPMAQMDWNTFRSEGFKRFKAQIQAQQPHPGRPPSTYSQSLERTSAYAMYHSCCDLVRLSDEDNLLDRFLQLPCRKLYLQDEDSRMPSRLESALRQSGLPVISVPVSGHGMMEDNPATFYNAVARFLEEK